MVVTPLLPDEVIFERIVPYLPLRTICRVAVTCRQWYKRIHAESEESAQCYDIGGECDNLWHNLKKVYQSNCYVFADIYCVEETITNLLRVPDSVSYFNDGTRCRHFSSSSDDEEPPSFDRDLVLASERMIVSGTNSLRREMKQKINKVRYRATFYGSEQTDDRQADALLPPTKGTTATFPLRSRGRYIMPVYYDWEANWEKVSALVQGEVVQRVLKRCLKKPGDRYRFHDFDSDTIWPFYFNCFQDEDQFRIDGLIDAVAPKALKSSHNRKVAKLMEKRLKQLLDRPDLRQEMSERVLESANQRLRGIRRPSTAEDRAFETPKDALDFIEAEVEDAVQLSSNADRPSYFRHLNFEDMSDKMMYDLDEMAEKSDLLDQFYENWWQECLCAEEDTPPLLRSTLLCTLQDSHGFLPLNYKLAQLLSPPGSDLQIHVSDEYAVVVDEGRNIVFDNFHYFCGTPASKALSEAKDPENMAWVRDHFDFTLGGLRGGKGKKRKRQDKGRQARSVGFSSVAGVK